jgi:hypothetical protein
MQKVPNPVRSTIANHEQHNREKVERWRAGEKNCAMHIQEKRRPRQEMHSRLLKRKQEQNLVKARPSTRITIQVCGRRVSFCSNPFTYSYLLLAIIMIHLHFKIHKFFKHPLSVHLSLLCQSSSNSSPTSQ